MTKKKTSKPSSRELGEKATPKGAKKKTSKPAPKKAGVEIKEKFIKVK
jgi:hypothetical protein